jgi:hypothetical protein
MIGKISSFSFKKGIGEIVTDRNEVYKFSIDDYFSENLPNVGDRVKFDPSNNLARKIQLALPKKKINLWELLIDTLKDFTAPKIRIILWINQFINLLVLLTIFFIFFKYVILPIGDYILNINFVSPESYVLALLFKYFIWLIASVTALLNIYVLWILIAIIIIPISQLIAGLFADKIFEYVHNKNGSELISLVKRGSFLTSYLFGFKAAIKTTLVNLVLLPLYLFLPIFGLIALIIINGYLLSREINGSYLVQYLSNDEIYEINNRYSNELLYSGSLFSLLLLVPILNFFVPVFYYVFYANFLIKIDIKN